MKMLNRCNVKYTKKKNLNFIFYQEKSNKEAKLQLNIIITNIIIIIITMPLYIKTIVKIVINI